MAASGRTSAPVAACGILVALGAPNSYNSIYSRFPFNGWVGAFTSEPGATVISRQRMFRWSEGDFATAIRQAAPGGSSSGQLPGCRQSGQNSKPCFPVVI